MPAKVVIHKMVRIIADGKPFVLPEKDVEAFVAKMQVKDWRIDDGTAPAQEAAPEEPVVEEDVKPRGRTKRGR